MALLMYKARGLAGALGVVPGLVLSGAVAAVALWAAEGPLKSWGLGALTLAILLGMLLGNSLYPALRGLCDSGVALARQRLLRLGIVLYGFRLGLEQLAAVGMTAVLIDVLMLTSTFLLACWLGRRVFGLDRHTTVLIGAGSSICGAAAVAATEPLLRAEAGKVAVAISTVVLFGTLGMFLYPWLFHLLADTLRLDAHAYGIYIGSTLHEVAQVVAAGSAVSAETGEAAVIAKMIRVMLLAPFLLLLAQYLGRREAHDEAGAAHRHFPWFALGFVAVVGFNSLHLLPAGLVQALVRLDDWLLAMAMAALGLGTVLGAIRQAGLRPMLLAGGLALWLVLGGALVNLAFAL